jgi:hypothetical protein
MTCQNCHEAEAAVFFTWIVSGETSQHNYCANCAVPCFVLLGMPHPDALKCSSAATFKFQLLLTPDPQRPSSLYLPPKISIDDLASSLRIKPYQVIGLLIELDDWSRPGDMIEFKSAAQVCARCGITTSS